MTAEYIVFSYIFVPHIYCAVVATRIVLQPTTGFSCCGRRICIVYSHRSSVWLPRMEGVHLCSVSNRLNTVFVVVKSIAYSDVVINYYCEISMLKRNAEMFIHGLFNESC